jgi:hypothetical protein
MTQRPLAHGAENLLDIMAAPSFARLAEQTAGGAAEPGAEGLVAERGLGDPRLDSARTVRARRPNRGKIGWLIEAEAGPERERSECVLDRGARASRFVVTPARDRSQLSVRSGGVEAFLSESREFIAEE